MAGTKGTKGTKKEEGEKEWHGFINVRVGTLPGRVRDYVLNGARTVAAAIQIAGIDAAGYEVRVNSEPAELAAEVEEGDQILVCKQIQGS